MIYFLVFWLNCGCSFPCALQMNPNVQERRGEGMNSVPPRASVRGGGGGTCPGTKRLIRTDLGFAGDLQVVDDGEHPRHGEEQQHLDIAPHGGTPLRHSPLPDPTLPRHSLLGSGHSSLVPPYSRQRSWRRPAAAEWGKLAGKSTAKLKIPIYGTWQILIW